MRWMFFLLVIATNVEAACEKIFVEGGGKQLLGGLFAILTWSD